MDGNILTGQAPEKETRQNGNTAFRNMPSPNKPAAPLPATDNHHTITNTKLFCCVPALLLLLSLTAIGCRKNPVAPVTEPKISITVEDVSCTEAWVRIKTQGLEKLQNPQFLVNDKPLPNFVLLNGDTLVYVESLKVKQQYTFAVTGSYRTEYDKEKPVSSAKQTATTMDTTGSNFTWDYQEFGAPLSTGFSNAVIVNKNDIYVVGDLRNPDSLNTFFGGTCSGVHWDGVTWSYLQPYFYYSCNSIYLGPSPTHAIWANPNGEIWMNGSFETARLKQGQVIKHDCVPDGRMKNMWGANSNEVFAVGVLGSAYHFTGDQWSVIESGTTLSVSDVWGYKRNTDNGVVAFMSFSDAFQNAEEKILRIEKGKIDTIAWVPQMDIFSLWMEDENKIYTAGGGVFCKTQKGWREEKGLPYIYTNKIRGTAKNNIWVCGHFGLIAHFNGVRWVTIDNFLNSGLLWKGIGVKDNMAVIVGYNPATTKAVVLIVEIH